MAYRAFSARIILFKFINLCTLFICYSFFFSLFFFKRYAYDDLLEMNKILK